MVVGIDEKRGGDDDRKEIADTGERIACRAAEHRLDQRADDDGEQGRVQQKDAGVGVSNEVEHRGVDEPDRIDAEPVVQIHQTEDLRRLLQPFDQLQMIEAGIVAQRRDQNAEAIHRQNGGEDGQHGQRALAQGGPKLPAVEHEAGDPHYRGRHDERELQRDEEIRDEADRRNQKQAQDREIEEGSVAGLPIARECRPEAGQHHDRQSDESEDEKHVTCSGSSPRRSPVRHIGRASPPRQSSAIRPAASGAGD